MCKCNFASCFVWVLKRCLTFREHKLQMSENRVLNEIFEHKNNEVNVQFMIPHNDEL